MGSNPIPSAMDKEVKEEYLTAGQIRQQYEEGRRNFDAIKSKGQDFHGFVLKRCSFRKADLSWGHFDTADFSNCDFTEANFIWSGIRHADLRNAKFTKANVSYCDFNGSDVQNADFSNADMTATLLFNVNIAASTTKGANMSWAATSIMQLTEEGFKFAVENLRRIGMQIPPELLAHLQLLTVKLHEKKKQLAEMKMAYQVPGLGRKESSVYESNIGALEKDISK